MAFFKYENKNIYYQEIGEGKPLVFLHGNTASSNMFYEVIKRYEKEYKVILIDFLGHGNSDRLDKFPADLWYYEAQQVIAFLKEKKYPKVDLIGSSGGAIVAINVALEAGSLINHVIADSFEGEVALAAITDNLVEDREESKHREDSRWFYEMMHGEDWESIVDLDTAALIEHKKSIQYFYHRDISTLQSAILLTGSRKDEFTMVVGEDFFDITYNTMLKKIGHGKKYIFSEGGHPAMLSNMDTFYERSIHFLKDEE